MAAMSGYILTEKRRFSDVGANGAMDFRSTQKAVNPTTTVVEFILVLYKRR